jgi:hypothetical protein
LGEAKQKGTVPACNQTMMIWWKRCTQWHGGTWTMMPMTSLSSGPRLYCRLSKVRWTCWGADMRWQSRIKTFTVKLYILLDAHLLAID